jgi:hypothetical protein
MHQDAASARFHAKRGQLELAEVRRSASRVRRWVVEEGVPALHSHPCLHAIERSGISQDRRIAYAQQPQQRFRRVTVEARLPLPVAGILPGHQQIGIPHLNGYGSLFVPVHIDGSGRP